MRSFIWPWLDRRFLAGRCALFEKLDHQSAARVGKTGAALLLGNPQLTRERLTRLRKYVFHLEPTVKESRGGLRDIKAACGSRIVAKEKGFATSLPRRKSCPRRPSIFLAPSDVFCHYSNGRNDNTLTYEAAAGQHNAGLGVWGDGVAQLLPKDGQYFRHARTLNRQLFAISSRKAPVPLTLRQRFFNAAARRQIRAR